MFRSVKQIKTGVLLLDNWLHLEKQAQKVYINDKDDALYLVMNCFNDMYGFADKIHEGHKPVFRTQKLKLQDTHIQRKDFAHLKKATIIYFYQDEKLDLRSVKGLCVTTDQDGNYWVNNGFGLEVRLKQHIGSLQVWDTGKGRPTRINLYRIANTEDIYEFSWTFRDKLRSVFIDEVMNIQKKEWEVDDTDFLPETEKVFTWVRQTIKGNVDES